MDNTEKSKYIHAIETTGISFEHYIAALLEAGGWILLTNKYYIDDVTSQAREIDIIAYKWQKFDEITLYTALVISCKKSDKNNWTFATRKLKNNDPNIKYQPLTGFTNSKILKAVEHQKYLLQAYQTKDSSESWLNDIFETTRFIFGFQEVSKASFTPQNDRNIYDSISTVVKALNYEIQGLNDLPPVFANLID